MSSNLNSTPEWDINNFYIRPEKIKIGDKKFRSIRHEILETLEENIKKRL